MNEVTENRAKQPDSAAQLDSDQVAQYLAEHPDFFERHSELLINLSIPHGTVTSGSQGQTVSLIERQVSSLRDENGRLKQQLNMLIDNARANDKLFDKAKALVLALISASDLEQAIPLVENRIREDFGSTCCRLWLIGAQDKFGSAQVLAQQEIMDRIPRLIDSDKPYCGLLKEEESELLFADQAGQVGSAAVIPLYLEQSPIAILAIANEDRNYYRNNMSTSLLSYIGEVVALVIHRLLPD